MKTKKFAKKLTLNKKTIVNFIKSKEMQKIKGGTAWATCNTCSEPPYDYTCYTKCEYSCGQIGTCNGGPC